MKVWISNYRDHWISPYVILDRVFFWTDWSRCNRDQSLAAALDEDRQWVDRPEWVDRWADRLTPISRGIQWVLDRVHPRVKYVRVDRWDTWSMDSTLSPIVLPMLRQLRATAHGSPFVDDADVPEHLQSTAAPPRENEYDVDANHHARWEWVLDEMIFAFEKKCQDDWTQEFHTGKVDIEWVPVDADGNEVAKGEHRHYEMRKGPRDTSEWDMAGQEAMQKRITNGFRLFGKYFEALWD